jgi:hypothetical protein
MARQPSGLRTPTIVYASFLNDGQPAPPKPGVLAFLAAGGVRTLVCGHQPHGDSPVVMRSRAPGGAEVTVVTADTSFSAQVEWRKSEEEVAEQDPEQEAGGANATARSSLLDPFDPFAKPRGPAPKASPQTRGTAVADVLIRDVVISRAGGTAAAVPADERTSPGQAGAPGATGSNQTTVKNTTDRSSTRGGGGNTQPTDSDGAAGATLAAEQAGGFAGAAEGLAGSTDACPQPAGTGSCAAPGVRVRARLSNGEEVEFDTAREPEVGRLRPDGWWVKGKLRSGQLLLSRGKGYRVENAIVQGGREGSPAAGADGH